MTNPKRDDVSMDERMPAEVELRRVGLSFTLGAGKNLSRTWQRELRTESESRFRSTVTRNSLEINFSPPLLIDAIWPAMNMQLGGLERNFSTGQTSVALGPIHGVAEGLIDFTEDAKKEIGSLITNGVQGTAMAHVGYNPMQDARIISTLETLCDHFRREPSKSSSAVEYRDFGNPHVEVNLVMKTEFRHVDKNAGIAVRSGTTIDVLITGQGNLATIMASHSTAGMVEATKVESVTISSDGLLVIVNDKPIAYLDRLRIDRGGAVTLEKMRLEGVVGQAEGMEYLVRLTAAALKWAASGASIEAGLTMAVHSGEVSTTVVPDIVREQIEKTLTEGVKQLLIAYRNVVPEIDLVQVMQA